jgi:hypothetical protein
MAIINMDRSKLIKFLNLSASKNDGEALSAIRKTHNFLEFSETNWEELLEPKIIKENIEDYAVLHMNLMKERAYSQELENKIRGFKNIIKYLVIFIIILIVVIILK